MAKRIGVLQADEPATVEPRDFVSKTVARMLLRKLLAVKVGPRVIQMVKISAARVEQAIASSMFWDGPLGVGNVVPFAKAHNYGDKLHYEIPMAGDRGAFARHRRKLIRVSARSGKRYLAAAVLPTHNFAPGLLAG